jgi:uncharacterized membrane-anchored protein YhcB (DUF1043 family)
MSQKLDTFADMTPQTIDTQAETAPSQPNNAGQPNVQQATDMNNQVANSGLDTFDNPEPIIPDSIKTKGESNAEEQKQAEESENSEETEIKRETDNLEMQEADDNDEGEAEGESGEEGEDSTTQETEQDSEEAAGTEFEGKTIRLKNGDESFDIPENATLPVKVKGKKEFVSLNDLKENYSGRKAWGQEIEKTKAERVEIQQERETFDHQRAEVREHFAKIGEALERTFTDPEADPLEAINYLIDLSGRNVLDYQKRMMDYFGNKAMEFYEMDESQQQLYWTQKENEILRNNQATRDRLAEERNAQEQRNTQEAQVREQYGVSEEQYQAALEAIEQQGFDVENATVEQVSHWAALTPLAEQAAELAKDFKDELSDDEYDNLIAGTADTLFKFQDIEAVEALRITAKRMGFEVYSDDDLVERANRKVPQNKSRLDNRVNPKKYAQRQDDHIETFDDFENEIYFNRR